MEPWHRTLERKRRRRERLKAKLEERRKFYEATLRAVREERRDVEAWIRVREELVETLEEEERKAREAYERAILGKPFRWIIYQVVRRRVRREVATLEAQIATLEGILAELRRREAEVERRMEEELAKLEAEIRALTPFRVQKAHMWYRTRGWRGRGNTPEPFAMVSVFVYTFKPERYPQRRFDRWLRMVETYKWRGRVRPTSLKPASELGAAYYRVQGVEEEEVDYDEVQYPPGQIRWYFLIYGSAGRAEYEYWGMIFRNVVIDETAKPEKEPEWKKPLTVRTPVPFRLIAKRKAKVKYRKLTRWM